eukprot:TRINITY_DN268_c0_g1_i1.p3 TRINITY_DN268_c0_g1~~TRINITY_DN268_c0_g1_i1.p3  ORF type:complete len:288 (+),score=83.47 TRINITY_DN268_c0_g1_i1:70-933(+)
MATGPMVSPPAGPSAPARIPSEFRARSSSPGPTESQHVSPEDSMSTLQQATTMSPVSCDTFCPATPFYSFQQDDSFAACPQGHRLREVSAGSGPGAHCCTPCGNRVRRGTVLRCEQCDYSRCTTCEGLFSRVGDWMAGCCPAAPPAPEHDAPEPAAPAPAPAGALRPGTAGVPAMWAPDDVSTYCQSCQAMFHLLRWKHHCRACGRCVCHGCSTFSSTVPDMGIEQEVRVCRDCWEISHEGGLAEAKLEPTEPQKGSESGRLCSELLDRWQAELRQQLAWQLERLQQ